MSEPPIGIEPMTYALRVTWSLAADALAAPMAREIALMALTALGLPGDPFHDPFHARCLYLTPPWSLCVTTGGAASRADEHARASSGPAATRPLPPMPGPLTWVAGGIPHPRPDTRSLAPRLSARCRGALSHARRGRADRGKARHLGMTDAAHLPVGSGPGAGPARARRCGR